MTDYLDFDYDRLPPVDLDLDLHWVVLPKAVWEKKRAAAREAQRQARAAEYPDHKIILVRADPDYSPIEDELWPLINETVLACLEPHPEILAIISATVHGVLGQHRGWRNPDPINLDDTAEK